MSNGNYHKVIKGPNPHNGQMGSWVVIQGQYLEVKERIDPDTGRPYTGILYDGAQPVVQRLGFGPDGLEDVIVFDDTSEPELPPEMELPPNMW